MMKCGKKRLSASTTVQTAIKKKEKYIYYMYYYQYA